MIPVVWNDRLLLFWLRILRKGPDTAQKTAGRARSSRSSPRTICRPILSQVLAVLCWSEYYNGKWQPTKTSDVNNPVSLGTFSPSVIQSWSYHPESSSNGLLSDIRSHISGVFTGTFWLSAFDRSTLRLRSDEPQAGQLRITIYGGVSPQAFLLYNTHSLPLPYIPAAIPPPLGEIRTFNTAGPGLTIDYDAKITDVPDNPLSRQVITDDIPASAVQPNHDVSDIWNAPFFVEDGRHVFLVTTVEQPVWIRTFPDYGILVNPGVLQAAQIAPLVVQPPPTTET